MNNRVTKAKCQVFRDAASDYLDGYLAAAKHVAYSAHIDECEDCFDFLRNLTRVIHALNALGVKDVSAAAEADIVGMYKNHTLGNTVLHGGLKKPHQLWAELRLVPASRRAELVSQQERFRRRDLCEWLAAHSRSECHSDAHIALELADVAILVGAHLPPSSASSNLLAECWSVKAVSHLALSEYASAEKDVQVAEELVEAVQTTRRTKARLLMVRASLLSTLGRPHEALPKYRECLEIFEKLGERVPAISMRINIGSAYLRSGEPESARQVFEHVLALVTEDDGSAIVFGALLNLAITYCELQRASEAERLMSRLVEVSKDVPANRIHLKWLAGSIARTRGECKQALNLFRGVQDFFRQSGEWIHYVECSLDIARVYVHQGDWLMLSALVRETKLAADAMCADQNCLQALRLLENAVGESVIRESSLRAASLLLASRLAWRDASF